MDTCMYTYMYVYMSLSIYKDIKMSYECVHAACSVMSDSFATPWTVVHQVPLSMGFFRQENWSGLSFPPPGVHIIYIYIYKFYIRKETFTKAVTKAYGL